MDNAYQRRVSAAGARVALLAFSVLLSWPAVGAANTESRWSVRLGYARVSFDTDSVLAVAGQSAPGAAVTIDDQTVLLGDAGFAINDRWSAHVAMGAPVDLPVSAAGSLRALAPPLTGKLGEIQIAPVIVSGLYAPRSFGSLRPYVGAGLVYAWVRETEGKDVQSLDATSEWGFVAQAGCEASLGQRWSVFVDARKLLLDTSVSGVIAPLGGVPVTASVDLDPLILNAGVGYRF
jgi:outer membrane protein